MILLLTGVTGTLGSDLKKLFPDAISPPHNEFDICDKSKVDEFFKNNHIAVSYTHLTLPTSDLE